MSNRRKEEIEVPTLSAKEGIVLDLLLRNPATEMYGLELVRESGRKLARGTIYVTLSRMEDKQFVQSRLEERQPNVSGMPRRLYRATGYGQKVYEAWQLAREAAVMHFATGNPI
jgi:DNA-binding PadR family transcriptional regulator